MTTSLLIRDTIPVASTRSRFVYVDSRDRSRLAYPHTNDYVVTLPDPLYGVRQVELLSAEIPKSEFFLAASDNDTIEVVFDPAIHSSKSPTGTTGWPVLLRVAASTFALFRVDISGDAHGHIHLPITAAAPWTFNASQTSYLTAATLQSEKDESVFVVAYSEPDTDNRASCRVLISSTATGQILAGSEFGFDSDSPVFAKHMVSLGDGRRFLVAYAATTSASGTTTSSVRAIVASTGVDPNDTAFRSTNATAFSVPSETVVAHITRALPDDRILVVYKTDTSSLRAIVVSVSAGFAVTPHFPATTVVGASAKLGDFDVDVLGDRILLTWTSASSRVSVAAARIVASTVVVSYADDAMTTTTLPYAVDDAVRVRFLSDAVSTRRLDAYLVDGFIVLRDAVTGDDFPSFTCVQGEQYRFIVRPASATTAASFALFTSASTPTPYDSGVSGSLFLVTETTPRTLWYGARASSAVSPPSASRGIIGIVGEGESTTALDFGLFFVGAHDPGNLAYSWASDAGHGESRRSTRVSNHHSLGGNSRIAGFASSAVAVSTRVVVIDANMDVWISNPWMRVPTVGPAPCLRTGATAWLTPDSGLLVFGGRLDRPDGGSDVARYFSTCVIHRVDSTSIVVRDIRNARMNGSTTTPRTTYETDVTIAYGYSVDVRDVAAGSSTFRRDFFSARLGVGAWSAPFRELEASLFPDRGVTFGVSVPANVARSWRYTHPHSVLSSSYTFDVLVRARLEADLSSGMTASRAQHVELVLSSSVDGEVSDTHSHVLSIGGDEWVRASVGVSVPPPGGVVCVDFEVRPVFLASVTIGLRDPGFFVDRVEVSGLEPGREYDTIVTFTSIDDEAEVPRSQSIEYEMARMRTVMPPLPVVPGPSSSSFLGDTHILDVDLDTFGHACLLRGAADVRVGDARVRVGAVVGAQLMQASGHTIRSTALSTTPTVSPGFDGLADASLRFDGSVCCVVTGDDVIPSLRAVETGAFDVSCYIRGCDDVPFVLHAPMPLVSMTTPSTSSAFDSVSGAAPTTNTGLVTSSYSLPPVVVEVAAGGTTSGWEAAAFRFATSSSAIQYEAPVSVRAPNHRSLHVGFFALALASDLYAATRSRPVFAIGSASSSIHVHIEHVTGIVTVFLFSATIGGGGADVLYTDGARLTPGVWQQVFVSVDLDTSATEVHVGGSTSAYAPQTRIDRPLFVSTAAWSSITWGGIDPRATTTTSLTPTRILVALPCIASSASYRALHNRGIVPEAEMTIWSVPIATGGTFGLRCRRSYGESLTTSYTATMGASTSVTLDVLDALRPPGSWSHVSLRRSDEGDVDLVVTRLGEPPSSASTSSSLSLALISSSAVTLGAVAPSIASSGSSYYSSALIGDIDELSILPRARTIPPVVVGRRRNAWRHQLSVVEDGAATFRLGLLPRSDAAGVVDENGNCWLYGGVGDAGTCADVWLLSVSAASTLNAYNMLPTSAPAGNVDPDPTNETPGSRQLHAMCIDGSSPTSDAGGGQVFFVYGGLVEQRVGPFHVYGVFVDAHGVDSTGASVPLPTTPGALVGYIYPLYTSRVAALLDFSESETVSIGVASASSSSARYALYTTTTSSSWIHGPRVSAPPPSSSFLFDPSVHIDNAVYDATAATVRSTTTAEVRGDLWSYNVSTGTWRRLYDAASSPADAPAAPSPRYGAHIWHHHNHVFVFGGAGGVDDPNVYDFDLSSRTWTVRSGGGAGADAIFAPPSSSAYTFGRDVTPGSNVGSAIFYTTLDVTSDTTSLRPAIYAQGATFVNQLEGAYVETNQHYAVSVRGSVTFGSDGFSAPTLSVDADSRSTIIAEPVTPALRIQMLPSVAPGAMLVLTNADASASACVLSAVQLSIERADADAVTIAAAASTEIDTIRASHAPSLMLAGALPRGTLDDFILVPGVTRLRIDLSDVSNRGEVVTCAAASAAAIVGLTPPYVVASTTPAGFTGSYLDILDAPKGESRLLIASSSGSTAFSVVVYTSAMLRDAIAPSVSSTASFSLHTLAPPAPLQTLLPAGVSARTVQMALTDSDASSSVVAIAFQDNDDARRGKVAHVTIDFTVPAMSAASSVSTFSASAPTLNIALCDRVREGRLSSNGGAIVAHAGDSGEESSGLFLRAVSSSPPFLGPETTVASVSGIGDLSLRTLDWHTSASASHGVWLTSFTYLGVGRVLPHRINTASDLASPVVQTLVGETLHYTATPLVFISGLYGGVRTVRLAVFPPGGDLAGDAVVVVVGGAESDLRYFDIACRDADPAIDAASVRLYRRTVTFSLLEDVTLVAKSVADARVLAVTTVRDSRSAFIVVYTLLSRVSIHARAYEWSDGSYAAATPTVVADALEGVSLDDVVIIDAPEDGVVAVGVDDTRVVCVSYVCSSGKSSVRLTTFPLNAVLADAAVEARIVGRTAFLSLTLDNSSPIVDAAFRVEAAALTGVATHSGAGKETGVLVRRTIDVDPMAFATADALSGSMALSRSSSIARMTEGDYALIGDFVSELDMRLKILDPSFSVEYSTATTKITLRNEHSAFRVVLSASRSGGDSTNLQSNVGLAYILGFRDYGLDVTSVEGADYHYARAPSRVDMRGRSYVYIYVGDGSEWFSSESARGRQAALGRLQLAVSKGETMYWTTGSSFSIQADVQVQALKHISVRFGRYPLIAEMGGEHRATMLYDTAGVEHSFTLRITCLNDKTGSGQADFRARIVPRLPMSDATSMASMVSRRASPDSDSDSGSESE